jgi:hypothetical protein
VRADRANDPLRDRVGGLAAVAPDHVGPAPQHLLQSRGLTVVDLESSGDRLLGVVRTILLLATPAQALSQLVPWDFQPHGGRARPEAIEPRERLTQSPGLGGGPRVAIEDESLIRWKRLQALSHELVGELVGNQFPRGHQRANSLTVRRIGLGALPENLPRTDMGKAQALGEALRLRPLTGSGRSEQNHLGWGRAHRFVTRPTTRAHQAGCPPIPRA